MPQRRKAGPELWPIPPPPFWGRIPPEPPPPSQLDRIVAMVLAVAGGAFVLLGFLFVVLLMLPLRR